MSGAHGVLGAFTGIALAVVVTILRVWLVNRFASPDRRRVTVPPSADVLEAERRAARGSSLESTDPTSRHDGDHRQRRT